MKATRANMKDQILIRDGQILHCPKCGAEYSGNTGDYWDVTPGDVLHCGGCDAEMELVTKVVTVTYEG